MHLVVAQQNGERSMADDDFHLFNIPKDYEQPDDISDYFSLTATSNTRIGRNQAGLDEASCPIILKHLRCPLVLAEVTVSVEFRQLNFDQAGLVVFPGDRPINPRPRSTSLFRTEASRWNSSQPMEGSSFAKVAFESCSDELMITTLVARPGCATDWASTSITPCFEAGYLHNTSMPSIRLKLERVGRDLWFWFLVPDPDLSFQPVPTPDAIRRRWRKCREVGDFFEASRKGCWVGCYASRPLEAEHEALDPLDDSLFVEFEDLVIM